MSASKSFLSDPKYGYDVVVATTQASINATMKQFLSKLKEPVATVCYVADATGSPALIDYDALVAAAHGSDPFKVPAGADPSSNKDLMNLRGARFKGGFRARLGLPPGYHPNQIPDLVVLGSDTAAVTFNMLCSEFDIVEYQPGGGYNPPIWTRLSQPAGAAWIFQSKVDLRLSELDQSAFNTLPPEAQAKIKELGPDAFSVQQLLFDLANAGLAATIPVIPGVPAESLLTTYFLKAYFTQLRKEGEPMLGVTVTRKPNGDTSPTLTLTDLNFNVNPFVGDDGQPLARPTAEQQGLATLNYLCAADENPLPPAVKFNWNWIDPSEESDYHGVAVTRRAVLADTFEEELRQHALKNCNRPNVTVAYTTGAMVGFSNEMIPGQQLRTNKPSQGSTVLTMTYDSKDDLGGKISYDEAGWHGASGWAKGWSSYSLELAFAGDAIKITQQLLIHYEASNTAETAGGDAVNKTLTSTYPLAITGDGRLILGTPVSDLKDNSDWKQASGAAQFFTNLNTIANTIGDSAKSFAEARFSAVDLATTQSYVFPGGKTFAFKAAAFSDNQDLVAHITYVDPV